MRNVNRVSNSPKIKETGIFFKVVSYTFRVLNIQLTYLGFRHSTLEPWAWASSMLKTHAAASLRQPGAVRQKLSILIFPGPPIGIKWPGKCSLLAWGFTKIGYLLRVANSDNHTYLGCIFYIM